MKTHLLIAVLAAASALPAQAQTNDPMKAYIEGSFVTIDKNKDGTITRSEFDAFMRARYAKQSTKFEAMMTEIDKDRDGKVSPAEAAVNAEFAQSFKLLDLNSDGFLSKEELISALIAAQMLS